MNLSRVTGLCRAFVLATVLVGMAPAHARCPAKVPSYEKRLVDALNSRNPQRILAAVQTVRAINQRELSEPVVPTEIPGTADLKRKVSDKQVNAAIARLEKRLTAQRWWTNSRIEKPGRLLVSPANAAIAIESFIVLSGLSEGLRGPGLKLASEAADFLMAVSEKTEFPGMPLPMQQVEAKQKTLSNLAFDGIERLGSCIAEQKAATHGWLVVPDLPELHFQDTAMAAEALANLSRVVDDPRYSEWARNASRWLWRQPIASRFYVNAFPVAMDAELYLTTLNREHLLRALDRAKYGIIPGMITRGKLSGRWIGLRSNTLSSRLILTRALVKTATALVAAPAGEVKEEDRIDIIVAAQKSWRTIEADLATTEGVAQPGLLLATIMDIDRAKRAGMPFGEIDEIVLKKALAVGVRRLLRGLAMDGAAGTRLLAALQRRAWRGAFRTPK